MRNTLITKLEKLYLYLFLCGDRLKLERIKNQIRIDEENELLREKYFGAVGNLKKMYKDGRLILTQKTLERAQVYLNEDRYQEALGLGRREVDEREARRFNRMAVGAEIKDNERMKAEGYSQFGKRVGGRQRTGDGLFIDPNQDLMIDATYMDEGRKGSFNHDDFDGKRGASKNGKTVGLRPASQQTFVSGGGYMGEGDFNETKEYLHSTSKMMGGTHDFESIGNDTSLSPPNMMGSQNGRGFLDSGLQHRDPSQPPSYFNYQHVTGAHGDLIPAK